ncbi:MAG: DUF4845 domain-containing protein [Gallionella sp.]|jgi:hypothetical protein|nr:DUF4845 domain-containing protein [Gallionella sp.]
MDTAMLKQQTGITFSGFIVGAFLLVVVTLFGFKLIPAYLENVKIQHIFDAVSHDPAMQNAGAHDLLLSYDRRASVEGIDAIKSGDIELSKSDNGRPILTASYAVKVKVGGNVSLYLEFNPTSADK